LIITCSTQQHHGAQIIVVVDVGAMKIYVAAVEALRKKERQDETQFITKIGGKTNFRPSYFIL
jgi:hypothetical protein